jgi:hypothetical protein
MSNPLAIATVTAALHNVLHGALPASGVAGATVANLRPDAANLPLPGINVFLFQVTPNAALRNADLPTRRADGSLLRRPQAALDLHYLLTFYGDDSTFDQQRLLGAAVRQLHAFPVLGPDAIAQALSQFPALAGSDLASQIDVVRVTPANLSLEELSKLWMIFPDVDYVLSAVYVAGVVLIETDDVPPGPAPPVLRPCVTAVPFSLASIHAVEPQPVELAPSPPTPITLVGSNLDPADEVTFMTPGKPAPLTGTVQSAADDTQLTVLLPAGLRPGVNTVRLTHLAPAPVASSSAPPRVLAQSNAAPFVLRPTVVRPLTQGSPPGAIMAVVSPPVGPQQQVLLLLNQISAPASASAPPGLAPPAFALPAAAHPAETDTVVFDYTNFPGGAVPAGTYLARVRVDEAESGLEPGASGKYSGPLVTIP